MNNLSNTSIEELKCKELKLDIHEMLKPGPECCIYRVPIDLRKIDEVAYTPQLISIGPFHHGKIQFVEMEKQKVRYKREFSKRITDKKWEKFITFIQNDEQHIRNCYSETFDLQSLEFITMVLYDAIFIIELLLKYRERENDFLLDKPRFKDCLQLDLQLLENQLPYFVLEELYKLAEFHEENYPADFFDLSWPFFSDSMFNGKPDQAEVKHFTDLRRNALLKNHPKSYGSFQFLPCAVKLHASGVQFKVIKRESLLNIALEKGQIAIPWLTGLELQMPCLEIMDQTETLIRNVMALEQCHYPSEPYVCNYISLIDFLIDTDKDVDLLVEKEILMNCLGDYARLVRMFNRLCLNITVKGTCFHDIVKDLNTHYDNGWNHAKATLKSVYFGNPWKCTGTIAGIILLLLTFIQTICAIMQF